MHIFPAVALTHEWHFSIDQEVHLPYLLFNIQFLHTNICKCCLDDTFKDVRPDEELGVAVNQI